jgi:hypothetical protein
MKASVMMEPLQSVLVIVPSWEAVAKRFVLEAVVAKKFVVVAEVVVEFPVIVREPTRVEEAVEINPPERTRREVVALCPAAGCVHAS